MPRTIAITKRIDLAEFSEGWDGCYVVIRPATRREVMDFKGLDLKDLSADEQFEEQMKIIRSHFVSGKVRILEGGEQKLVDMEPDDVEASIPLADRVFFVVLGVTLDPKDLSKAA